MTLGTHDLITADFNTTNFKLPVLFKTCRKNKLTEDGRLLICNVMQSGIALMMGAASTSETSVNFY
jgi:hypothetical protein